MRGDRVYLVFRRVKQNGVHKCTYVSRVYHRLKDASNDVYAQYQAEQFYGMVSGKVEGKVGGRLYAEMTTSDGREVKLWTAEYTTI